MFRVLYSFAYSVNGTGGFPELVAQCKLPAGLDFNATYPGCLASSSNLESVYAIDPNGTVYLVTIPSGNGTCVTTLVASFSPDLVPGMAGCVNMGDAAYWVAYNESTLQVMQLDYSGKQETVSTVYKFQDDLLSDGVFLTMNADARNNMLYWQMASPSSEALVRINVANQSYEILPPFNLDLVSWAVDGRPFTGSPVYFALTEARGYGLSQKGTEVWQGSAQALCPESCTTGCQFSDRMFYQPCARLSDPFCNGDSE